MKYTFRIIFGLIGLFLFGLLIYGGNIAELNGEQTDCYDRYSNKIIGESCIVEGSFDSRATAITMSAILGICAIAIMWALGYVVDDTNSWGGR